MGKKYVVQIDGDISALQKKVSQANSTMRDLGKNKVAIDIDYDHGKIEDIRNLVQSISEYSPEIKVQLNYDLFEATYKQKTKELAERQNLLSLFNSEKSGNGGLSQYIDDLVAEIDDGLDSGVSKIDLQGKLERALDLSGSYTKLTGKYIDDMALDAIFDMQNRFPKLEDYAPKENLFDGLEDQLKKDQAIIEGITLQMEDLKAKGAVSGEDIIDATKTQEAADQIDNIQGKLEKISEPKTVTIFDGVSEQVYNIEEEAEKVEEILDELASKWSKVGFRSASDFLNSDGRITDSLFDQLKSGADGPSLGSGTYFSQNFSDIASWGDAQGDVRKLFAADLSGVQNMLRVSNDEFLLDLSDALQSMHALIAKDIFPHENYTNILEDTGVSNIDDLITNYSNIFQSLHISSGFVKDFVSRQSEWLKTVKSSNDEIPEELKNIESFYGKFLQEALGVSGVDTSNLGTVDSSEFGSVLYGRLAETIPHIDFGDNKELYQSFVQKVFDNILFEKAKNPDINLDELFKSYTGITSRAFESGDMSLMTESSGLSEEFISKSLASLQKAKELQKEAQSLSIDQLNEGLFKQNDSGIDEYIQRLERLYQLQNTISNMDVEAFHGASYEEAGKHIEKLNAEYEQTIAEIDKLRAADDGSPAIKEQIGLLENLAVAYEKAIDHSFPDDVSKEDFLRKYMSLSTDDLYGDERTYRYRRLQEASAEFNKSIQDEMLKIYDTGRLRDVKVPDMTPKTSALEEMPEILGRIKSAYKETAQAAEGFNDSIGGEGATSALETENEQLRSEVEDLRGQLRSAQDSAYRAWDSKWESDEERDQAQRDLQLTEQELAEKSRQLQETQEELGRLKSSQPQGDLDNRPEFSDGSEQSAESAEAAAQAHEHAAKAAQEQAAAESALGDTPEFEGDTSEISQKNADGIREETQANKELTDSYRERSNAQDDAETQSSESTGATQEIQEETEANNEAAESYRDKAKAQEEVNTATSQSDTHTQDIREETEANEAAAKSARELADAEQEAMKAQQNKSLADQQTTASDTAESTGFDNVAQSATAAAQAKERFASANEKAKSAAEATTSSLMEEARAFKEIAEMGKQATSAKNGFVKEPKSERKSSVTQKQKDNEGISWRATSIKREFAGLTKAVGSNESLTELYGEQIDDFQKRVAKISSKTTTSEFEDLAADIRKVAEEIKNVDVDDIVSGFDKLRSGKNVIKNLFDVDDSKDAINSAALDEFIGKLDNLKSRVESVKDVFGEDSDQYITASEALDKYSESLEQYYKLYMDRSIDSMRNKLDISDVAEGQQEKFDEARSAFKEMTQIAEGFSIDDIFDSEKISSFVANLKIATDSTKDLKSKFDGLASTAQVDKLFSKVSADIKSNNLSGDLLGDFTKLREELAGATEDSEAVRRGFANISKEDFSKLVGQWQALRKEMYQTGQDGKSFSTRIGEAMTTQSAAFIARYFSFQDYIRYARELISTVTTLDTSIKELQKLTGASDEVMAKSFQTASQSAQEYGSTIDAVLNSTSDWRRLGYSLSESEDLAKVTTMYQNIANGIDQSSASEYMVSILQGFQMDAQDSLKIVDAVNEVAQNYAIDQAGGCARAYSNVGM